ncbi:hypothetical protein LTS03_009975 [Exophiala xenobiotica]|nr:hypothetical protein LTR41_000016 [Exophiala xenobiotica]KAK5347564.1 hypothetical protein LTR61_008835 [Exophiala xenobiotica]KAK5362657.1 hypothetical protein LTS03_009975 [Exophiala xenobiotica]
MLVKNFRRLAFLITPLLLIAVLALIFQSRHSIRLRAVEPKIAGDHSSSAGRDKLSWLSPFRNYGSSQQSISDTYIEVFSVSTKNGKYFLIEFGAEDAINPSILPHPTQPETWIIVAQQQRSTINNSVWFAELVCDAKFKRGKLACIRPPKILPIAATTSDKCVGDLSYFALNIGPHDARVFYGPSSPMLVDWGYEPVVGNEFRMATELQRPPPLGLIEKNWFVFWDKHEEAYAHYDVAPNRVYAKLGSDGSVGQDLAPLARHSDEKCMQRYMPKVAEQLESIHQATNSLSITLCKRSDLTCEPDDSNTYVLSIFQHKSFYSFHSVYEPYVMLFKRTSPFELHAISSKPIWIHGRGKAGEKRPKGSEFESLETWNQTEMFYVTSISWKSQGQKYHGYSDDVMFINFGIEDLKTAGVDIVAGELLKDIGICSSA